MATNNTLTQEMAELRSHLGWIDEERRKTNRRLAELEQQVKIQQQEISNRESRIKDLEQQLSDARAQIGRQAQFEPRLGQFKDEVVLMVEQASTRMREGLKEADRLRRVENEMHNREIAGILKQLPDIDRLRRELEVRTAEDARLSALIGQISDKVNQLDQRFDPIISEVAYANELVKRHASQIVELDTQLTDISRKTQDFYEKNDIVADQVSHVQADVRDLTESLADLRQVTKNWSEQIQIGEFERNNRLKKWEMHLTEQESVMVDYEKMWGVFREQHKKAENAVERLEAWREQQSNLIKESQERYRLDSNRLLTEWQSYKAENDKSWRHFETDSEQHRIAVERRLKKLQTEITDVVEELSKITDDRDMLWRIQTAQADALKQFPRIWLEEIERALEQNPNRRRQPTTVPVREE